jgi:hypothetical protein
LKGTPLLFSGVAARPVERMWRRFIPPITAPTMPSFAASSCRESGAPSRFSATAVASISMWPISSVPVLMSMSRYFFGPRLPQPWKRYCIITRISPSTPPIACCRARAKMGFGRSTRTGYCSLPSV